MTSPKSRLGRNRLLLSVIVFVVGAYGALWALEGALITRAWSRPPNDSVKFTWGHPVANNRLGYREAEVLIPKPPGVFRIMVLGDSLTWGVGLPVEDRYTARLAKRLGEVARGRRIEVLNFGVLGAPTTEERDILRRLAPSVDPDLVVLGFCVNDPQPRAQDYAVEVERYQRVFLGIGQLQRLHLDRTAGFLRVRFNQLLRNVGLVPQWPEALDRTYDTTSPEWKAFTQALLDIDQVTRERHLPKPIFISLLSLSGNYRSPDPTLKMILKWSRHGEEAASAAGFLTVSLEAAFMAEGTRSRSVNDWDNHPDARCHEVYARRLAEVIVPMLD